METMKCLWWAILELDFITSFFTWFFKLLNRLSEPTLTLAAIYVIISAGVPAAKITLAYEIAVAIMISAPEILLPGAFILASIEKRRGNKQARLLYGACYGFVGLTILTLASLFMFHFSEGGLNVLMFGRCIVGVGYSILIRVLMNTEVSLAEVSVDETPNEMLTLFQSALIEMKQDFTETLQAEMNRLKEQAEMLQSSFASAVEMNTETAMSVAMTEIVAAETLQPEVTEVEIAVETVVPEMKIHLLKPVLPEIAGPIEIRVKNFIREKLAEGHALPKVDEIASACQCSVGSASKYRREHTA
jgi:hypothetical protein